METSTFTINIRDEKYTVEPIDIGSEIQFKISTDCNYLMTVFKTEDGNWAANKDVEVLDESLITDIGTSIESYDA